MSIPGLAGIDASRTDGPVRPLARPRGLPAAFADLMLVGTADPEEASAGLLPILGPNRLQLSLPGARVSLHGVALPSIALYYLDAEADIRLDVPRTPAHQLVITPTMGTARLRTGPHTVDTTPLHACCPLPDERLHLQRPISGPVMILVIEQDVIRRGVDAMMGRSLADDVRLEVDMDLTADGAERWQTALQVLHSEVSRNQTQLAHDVDLLPLEFFLVSTLLMGQRSTCHAALHHVNAVRHNRVLRRVVQHIDANLTQPMSVGDLAELASVSARTLQLHFRESFDQTPTQYIRDRRLDRAHADLQRSDPLDQPTVTEVALRWGFHHEGRFAAEYRRRFGETPSSTRRR